MDRYYSTQIRILATEYPDRRSLTIAFLDLEKFDSDLAEALLENPTDVIEDAETALASLDLPTSAALDGAHIRVIGLPNTTPIRHIRSEHLSKLIAVDGLVRMATEVRPLIRVAEFECCGCGETIRIPQTPNKFTEPYVCPNGDCGRKGPFRLNLEKSEMVDVQTIRVQESPEDLRGGEQPQTLDILLYDDLAGTVSPGDHVVIVGILRAFQRVTREGKSPTMDRVLDGVSIEQQDVEFTEVEITLAEEQEILELSRKPNIVQSLIQSIAPTIYGYTDVKEGLALQMMSGISKHLPDGTRIRGDVHILLVGDPGIAKSQLLRYVIKLAPRGVYTSGHSSSAVGLTAAAVRSDLAGNDGRWVLEAGALVLADHGIAAIDELDKMSAEHRNSLHEAAEQQQITVAKAGILTTLKSRCAILAAANPKYGRFDPYEGIAQQIVISPALLSRFDLIFILRDEPNPTRDAAISDHILQVHYAGELHEQATRSPTTRPSEEQIRDAMELVTPQIPPDLLRKYIAYARKNVFPATSDEVRNRLREFYLTIRGQTADRDAPVPTTARQLEALVRLCEASARLRLDETVTLEDAERAIRVTLSCMEQVVFDAETGLFDVDVIEIGHSKSQRDKIKEIKEIIAGLVRDHGGVAPLELVAADAVAAGIDSGDLDRLIGDMLKQGEIMSSAQGLQLAT